MRFGKLIVAAGLAACLAGAPRGAAAADVVDMKTVARAAAAKSGKAVVNVRLVVKLKIAGARGGREQEQKLEILGTVIDPSGLTVVSASAVEPGAALNQFGGGRRGRGGDAAGGEAPRVESEVSETTILLEDGTEIEADVVFKDMDLDLAFVRPREAQKLTAVELKARGRAPELLEDVFTVTRLGRAEGRAMAVVMGNVKAVVKGPRTFFILTPEVSSGNQGCIAYGADGATLGVIVTRINASAGEGGGRGRDFATTILRPVEELIELAKQAKDAKAPERKPAAEKPAADPVPAGGEKKETEAPKGEVPAAPK